jgi:hypothetical protein
MSLPAPYPRHSVVSPGEVQERGGVACVLSHQTRKGAWTVPRLLRVVCVLGNTELDLREARIADGVTEIEVVAFCGSVEILLPPGLRVECHGGGLAGQFSFEPEGMGEIRAGAPTIVLKGDAYFASVEATVRLPGESARDARRRYRALLRGGSR